MLSSVLPAEVAVAEAFDDPEDAVLFPGEEAAISRAVAKRRREYITTRHCARLAMVRLGLPPMAVGSGGNREPLWPEGVVGSLTHCDGYRAAAVARSGSVGGVGVDAEPHAPLPDGVFDTIARPDEVPMLAELAAARPHVWWDRLMFSAKESVYKAWFPVAERWLGFGDASLDLEPGEDRPDGTVAGGYTVRIHQAGAPVTRMTGRWIVESGFVLTAITL
ncbi:4'-phosphopantetheinyl transferase superfamily protein [Catenulispora yoronensis]|uniref:4'-phosphopantetheinyl transferase superfamily protein n=1 Tax=Catenulispora yoronensis TaxID=450799 RepID=A0ABN2V8R8_9ACTN